MSLGMTHCSMNWIINWYFCLTCPIFISYTGHATHASMIWIISCRCSFLLLFHISSRVRSTLSSCHRFHPTSNPYHPYVFTIDCKPHWSSYSNGSLYFWFGSLADLLFLSIHSWQVVTQVHCNFLFAMQQVTTLYIFHSL